MPTIKNHAVMVTIAKSAAKDLHEQADAIMSNIYEDLSKISEEGLSSLKRDFLVTSFKEAMSKRAAARAADEEACILEYLVELDNNAGTD